jgi:hypothetical protein
MNNGCMMTQKVSIWCGKQTGPGTKTLPLLTTHECLGCMKTSLPSGSVDDFHGETPELCRQIQQGTSGVVPNS